MRRTPLRRGLAWLAAIWLLGMLPAPVVGAATGVPELRRWFGAEGGFEETACWAPGGSCPGLSVSTGFGGTVTSERTMTILEDPDGVERPWPARTGNRMFVASVPGVGPGTAYLTTNGTTTASASPTTISFSVRVHTPLADPVVIFRHQGDSPGQAFALALAPGGQLIVSAPGLPQDSVPDVEAGVWNTITVTYGGGIGAPFKVYLNSNLTLSGFLPFGGPSGRFDLGVVTPTSLPARIGIDDVVEAAGYDVPIHGARINYLIPLGQSGTETWTKSYPVAACVTAARNWQMVSEDQTVVAGGQSCSLDGGALLAFSAGRSEELLLEGVPSRHVASSSYYRDLRLQPLPGELVLGVRMRMRGRTTAGSPPLTWSLSYIEGGAVTESFTFDGGDGSGASRWGATYQTRPNGGDWTSSSLNGVRLRLDSGSGSGTRRVTEVRLDYVWVP